MHNQNQPASERLSKTLLDDWNAIKQIGVGLFFGLLAFAALVAVIVIVGGVGIKMGWWALPVVENPPPAPTAVILPTSANTPTPDLRGPTPRTTAVVVLELYDLEMTIPYNWEFEEVDRRPEPIDSVGLDHDCANYIISTTDGSQIITLYMPCHTIDGQSLPCPAGTQTINPTDGLVMVPYPERNGYALTQSYPGNLCDYPPVWFTEGMFITAVYSEPNTSLEEIDDLSQAAQIILSLRSR